MNMNEWMNESCVSQWMSKRYMNEKKGICITLYIILFFVFIFIFCIIFYSFFNLKKDERGRGFSFWSKCLSSCARNTKGLKDGDCPLAISQVWFLF